MRLSLINPFKGLIFSHTKRNDFHIKFANIFGKYRLIVYARRTENSSTEDPFIQARPYPRSIYSHRPNSNTFPSPIQLLPKTVKGRKQFPQEEALLEEAI